MTAKLFTTSLVATALLAGMAALPALAQGTYTPGIDQTQQAISARIQQGMQSGRITPSEAQALYRRDREIDLRESRFKANGNATPQERQQLRVDLNALSNDVERMIANRDAVRPGQANNTPGIDQREEQISQRIDEGLRSGRITQHEARRLHKREREIDKLERRFKADGVVSPQERRQLRDELNALRDQVERMLRNDRRR